AAVFPAVLWALEDKGVHVLTANDYLAERDAKWMGPIYSRLGLCADFAIAGMDAGQKRASYAADVTYLTAREAGFDYLRDGLAYDRSELVQRPFAYAIVDEADFLLIDEARVPLVIAASVSASDAASGDAACGVDPRRAAAAIAALGEDLDFRVDRREGKVVLLPRGEEKIEAFLGIAGAHEPSAFASWARVHAALRARALLSRDVDYVVREGRAELVDEFTGRAVSDRKWPYGVQTAIEAAEGLEPGSEGRIYGSIPVREFMRLYPRLCGMTATAVPSAEELSEAYGLGIVVVPPNEPVARVDAPDVVYRTRRGKTEAILRNLVRERKSGRPVLVGTSSVRDSEELAASVRAAGIPCEVLNAKNDREEARLVARSGELGAVTIATNMAGRGTDIRLASGVAALGGLYVIGTNRHESRRVDDQLRGRAGRQGDPGLSRFFSSLDDPLFERFGARFLLPREYRSAMTEEEAYAADAEGPIRDERVAKEIDRAQRIIEGRNHAARRALGKCGRPLEIDRRLVRSLRDAALLYGELPDSVEQALGRNAGLPRSSAVVLYLARLDRFWADHLAFVDDLREGAPLARYGGRDPDLEFVRRIEEAFDEGFRRAEAEAAADVVSVSAGAGDAEEPALAALDRPTGTWTYALDEDPLPAFSFAGTAPSAMAALATVAALPAMALAGIVSLCARALRRRSHA
ncbi:MAG: hypothetical protein Q8M76_12705, partial [Spirochaetaceae bacterium]|nr:hypothetical protein [Spirochaetaceae bacterium]